MTDQITLCDILADKIEYYLDMRYDAVVTDDYMLIAYCDEHIRELEAQIKVIK